MYCMLECSKTGVKAPGQLLCCLTNTARTSGLFAKPYRTSLLLSSSLSSSSSSSRQSTPSTSIVFDRALKCKQREWAVLASGRERGSSGHDDEGDSSRYDYLRDECARRLVDRLDDISKPFPKVLELGACKGHVFRAVDNIVDKSVDIKTGVNSIADYTLTDSSQVLLDLVDTANSNGISVSKSVCDSEELQSVLAVASGCDEDKFDMVITSLDFHWVNDIPATLKKVKSILKPDGFFIGCMLGGSTLSELRHCFYLCEQERRGGVSPHTSPLVKASDIAGLLQAAGFTLPTVDVDTLRIGYPDAFTLMEHLNRMGEGNAALNRHIGAGRQTLLSVASVYQTLYGESNPNPTGPNLMGGPVNAEEGIEATFQVIFFIGWCPDASQPKACRRGSHTKKIGDVV